MVIVRAHKRLKSKAAMKSRRRLGTLSHNKRYSLENLKSKTNQSKHTGINDTAQR